MTEEAARPPKADPESFAIRSRPPRVIRFRRGVIIAVSALGSASLVAVTCVALKPAVFRQVAPEEALSQPGAKGTADALSALPASYGDVPKLGPPLPGDLGRPILEHQRRLESAGEGAPARSDRAAQEAVAERQRALSELKSARESALLVSGTRQAQLASPAATAHAGPQPAADASKLPLDPSRDPDAQQRKLDFVAAAGAPGDIDPGRIAPAASPHVLSAGSVIAASLITGLRSDLPGLVTAQVTERVYDSPTGKILLIPQGARLIGSYDSVVAFGQRRALIVWQRILMPDGSSLGIDNVPATDPSGYAGLEDKVDRHSWQLIKGVVLSTLLGVGSDLAFTGDSDLVEAIRRSTQDNASRAGDQITMRNLNVQPTITIRPGAPVRLVVHKDLILAPWREGSAQDG